MRTPTTAAEAASKLGQQLATHKSETNIRGGGRRGREHQHSTIDSFDGVGDEDEEDEDEDDDGVEEEEFVFEEEEGEDLVAVAKSSVASMGCNSLGRKNTKPGVTFQWDCGGGGDGPNGESERYRKTWI